MDAVRVVVGDRRAVRDPACDLEQIRRVAQYVLAAEGCGGMELSVTLVDDEEIAELHERYLGVAGPTGSPYGHDPGTSVIAVAGPVVLSRTIETGDADREANMWRFTEAALELLGEALDTPR